MIKFYTWLNKFNAKTLKRIGYFSIFSSIIVGMIGYWRVFANFGGFTSIIQKRLSFFSIIYIIIGMFLYDVCDRLANSKS